MSTLEQQIEELENSINEEKDDATESNDVVDQSMDDLNNESDEGATDDVDSNDDSADGINESDSDDAQLSNRSDDEAKTNADWAKHRKEKQELAKQNQELMERLARLEGYQAAQAQAAVEEVQPQAIDQEPDPDLYPDEHTRWELRQLKQELAIQRQATQQNISYNQESAAKEALNIIERDFSSQANDYANAKAYLHEKRADDLKMAYPMATEAQIKQAIAVEEMELAKEVYANGVNPAEFFYNRAKNIGYNGEASGKISKQASTADNLQTLKKNKRKSGSLNGVSTAGSNQDVNSEQVVNMSLGQLAGLSDDQWSGIEQSDRNRYVE